MARRKLLLLLSLRAVAPLWGLVCAVADEPPLQALPLSTAALERLPDCTVDCTVGVGTLGIGPRAEDPSLAASEFDAMYGQTCWTWQILPDGLMYDAYLASGRESRFASHWFYERDQGWLWDSTLGGHVGLLRYGTQDILWPEGWQLDVEGAAFPRLTLEEHRDLVSVDFRIGVPLTFRQGPWEGKFAYYHLSSHLGDEYKESHPEVMRINYSRDALVLGLAWRPTMDLRLYAEAGYGFYIDGGTEPWEFQFGIDYSPANPSGICGAPFFAVNTRIREEVDFGGNFTVETGWQWRGETGKLFRWGFYYFNGMSDQYTFFREFEEHLGVGLWYDY
jgi:hypothetical protein